MLLCLWWYLFSRFDMLLQTFAASFGWMAPALSLADSASARSYVIAGGGSGEKNVLIVVELDLMHKSLSGTTFGRSAVCRSQSNGYCS
jgi:hypothetical protein